MKSRWKLGDIPPLYNSPLEQYNHEHRPQPRSHAGKRIYYFSIVVWILNIIACLLCTFIPQFAEHNTYFFTFFFVTYLFEAVEANLFKIKKIKSKHKTFFDYCITITLLFGISCAILSFIVSTINGGIVTIRYGKYCVMNHSELVKFITEEEYWKMKVIEALGMMGALLSGHSFGLRTIRQVYLESKNLTT